MQLAPQSVARRPAKDARARVQHHAVHSSVQRAAGRCLTVQVAAFKKDKSPEVKGPLAQAIALQEGPRVLKPEVLVKLSVPLKTSFGQAVKAVGSAPALGGWDLAAALPLRWTQGDVWQGELRLPAGKHEFKVVVLDTGSGQAEWEQCDNRHLEVPAFQGTLEVPCTWNSARMAPRFTDAPRPTDPVLADPLEVAAQLAARERALANAAQEERLKAARQSIQQTVVQLLSDSEPPGFSREQYLAAASNPDTHPSALATLSAAAHKAAAAAQAAHHPATAAPASSHDAPAPTASAASSNGVPAAAASEADAAPAATTDAAPQQHPMAANNVVPGPSGAVPVTPSPSPPDDATTTTSSGTSTSDHGTPSGAAVAAARPALPLLMGAPPSLQELLSEGGPGARLVGELEGLMAQGAAGKLVHDLFEFLAKGGSGASSGVGKKK